MDDLVNLFRLSHQSARVGVAAALVSMRSAGDALDADIMFTIEENNDKMRGAYAHSAQLRRAFIGVPLEYRSIF